MKTKKLIFWLSGMILLVLSLIIIILLHEPEPSGISRALAAKAVSLAMTDREICERKHQENTSHFSAKEKDIWYVKYMDYLYDQGFFSEELTVPADREATKEITYGEVEYLAESMSAELIDRVGATKKNRNKPYPAEKWWEFYEEILTTLDPGGEVKEKNLLLYGTPLNVEGSDRWVAYTNEGQFGFEGLGLDSYIDREIQILERSGEIIAVKELISEDVVYQNTWVLEQGEDDFLIQLGSVQRRMELPSRIGKKEELGNQIADIHLKKGKLKKIVVKEDRINGKVLAVRDEGIEIEGYGLVPFEEGFQVYQAYGTFQTKSLRDILVGYDLQEFAVADGKLSAALITRTFDAKSIRVLLKDTNFTSLFHQSVTLTCPEDMTVIYDDQKEKKVKAGEEFTLESGDPILKEGRIILEPEGTAEITVATIERAMGAPSYGGRLEISQEEEGLVLVNEVYLEDYLTKVVPSEMPASYEMEALKVQAVCARTYAYRQIQANGYRTYGAHVDDSISYQVYNNIQRNDRTDRAVQETYGQILTHGGQAIEAFYFSTSCGSTTDGSIWGSDPSLVPYLQGKLLRDDQLELDLTDNQTFSEFIKDENFRSYDQGYGFYRWKVTTDSQVLEEEITDIGTIRDISITERGPGGIAKRMVVTGSDGKKEITGQNPIRAALGNPSQSIVKKDGDSVTGWSSLPSSFLTVETGKTNEAGVTAFYIYGGGYGHGAGMSQNGSNGMAKAGWGYETILKFFYEGVEIKAVY